MNWEELEVGDVLLAYGQLDARVVIKTIVAHYPGKPDAEDEVWLGFGNLHDASKTDQVRRKGDALPPFFTVLRGSNTLQRGSNWEGE